MKSLLFILIICTASYSGVRDAFEYLRQNRRTVNDVIYACSTSTIYRNAFRQFREIDNMLRAKSVNDSIMNATVSSYLDGIKIASYFLNERKTDIISDSMTVSFLLKLVNGCSHDNNRERGCAWRAAELLREYTCYAALKKHKEQIRKSFINNYCVDNDTQNELIVFAGLTDSEKAEMLKARKLWYPFLARLGDTSAIKQLRTEYHNATDAHWKSRAINRIFLSNQSELIKMVVSDFNTPYYAIVPAHKGLPTCTSYSTQRTIIQQLQRIYPYEKLLNKDFIELNHELFIIRYRDRNVIQEKTMPYSISVSKWLEKKYNVKIADAPPTYIIITGKCVNID